MKKGLFILLIIVLVGAAVYIAYQKGYLQSPGKEKVSPWQGIENPLEKMPSTNPFAKIINPFKALYKNPFK